MAVDFNPMLARSLAKEQNIAEGMYDIGSLLAEKGYFPGKYLGGGLGLLGGAIAGLPGRIAPKMKDDSGLFQGGKKGRVFGRFRDEMEKGYDIGKEKGILGLSMKADDKVKAGGTPTADSGSPATVPTVPTVNDFVYNAIEDMPYTTNQQDYEMGQYGKYKNIPDKYWYKDKVYSFEDYPGFITKVPWSGKVLTGEDNIRHFKEENILGAPYRLFRDWGKDREITVPSRAIGRSY